MADTKAKVLIVDDEPEIVAMLKHFLTLKGYEAVGAFSGQEAMDILEKEGIDLVLLDIMMPGIKGGEVAKIIREKFPQSKIILLTGYSKEAEKITNETTLEGKFIKPINVGELSNKLAQTFNKEESKILNVKLDERTQARAPLIKAKILFIEPSLEIYNFLNEHFRKLSQSNENYELDMANDEEIIALKLVLFNPNIIAINATFFKLYDINIFKQIFEKNSPSREIIMYDIENINNLEKEKLERLTKIIKITCFKNKFIEKE